MRSTHCYGFGDFELDLALFELRRRGVPRKLDPRAFSLLHYLVEHSDRVVPKEELLAELWPDVTVSRGVLPSCVRRVRSALGQSARDARPIQTLHRRGYRLNMTVRRVPRSYSQRGPLDIGALDSRIG